MGNSSSKDRPQSGASSGRHGASQLAAGDARGGQLHAPTDRPSTHTQGQRIGSGRSNRHDLSFLHVGRERSEEMAVPERPRETKQERDARRAERDRQARARERERSLRDESVDGGYLVTLGTYTGPEDFNKAIVRQLQIERRLAPFWRGLNDHSDSWTEHQLVAVARGLPIPAPDEVPAEMNRTASQMSNDPKASDAQIQSLTVPISSRSGSYQSNETHLSGLYPSISTSGPSSPTAPVSSGQMFRGRAKTLASLATGKSQSPDMTPREVRLPHEPQHNGMPVEAYLYKDAAECPICFLYYPPYLNRTRCCDQFICSECFVQIKRPDPHPPEHEQPGQPRPPEEEAELLVSEVAACPFCVTPEFGVTYEPPPFRRGLAYASAATPVKGAMSPSASSTSLAPGTGRRRGQSLSASAPQVITTDRVRPDWAKKLADARAHALRRSAAATALHNAAYVLGNQDLGAGGLGFGRRRRTLFRDSPSGSGSGTPTGSSPALRIIDLRNDPGGDGTSRDLFPGRASSRRSRVDDLEELMMMEAIRLSLAAEEERKRKEEKEARKEAKKRAKEEKKGAKQAEKAARKYSSGSMYRAGTNESNSSWASTNMARSTSNLGMHPSIPEEQVQGKGKQPAQDFAGFHPLSEPTSTLNTEMKDHRDSNDSLTSAKGPTGDPQGHLEASRASLKPSASIPIPVSGAGAHHREMSNVSSMASSFTESAPGSFRHSSNLPSGNPSLPDVSGSPHDASGAGTPAGGGGLEPMFNFRSLAAMIGNEVKGRVEGEHVEHQTEQSLSQAEEQIKEPSPHGSPRPGSLLNGDGLLRSRGDSGESSGSSQSPPLYFNAKQSQHSTNRDEIEPASPNDQQADVTDRGKKEYNTGIDVMNNARESEAT